MPSHGKVTAARPGRAVGAGAGLVTPAVYSNGCGSPGVTFWVWHLGPCAG
jgi:hypothetical protein